MKRLLDRDIFAITRMLHYLAAPNRLANGATGNDILLDASDKVAYSTDIEADLKELLRSGLIETHSNNLPYDKASLKRTKAIYRITEKGKTELPKYLEGAQAIYEKREWKYRGETAWVWEIDKKTSPLFEADNSEFKEITLLRNAPGVQETARHIAGLILDDSKLVKLSGSEKFLRGLPELKDVGDARIEAINNELNALAVKHDKRTLSMVLEEELKKIPEFNVDDERLREIIPRLAMLLFENKRETSR